MLKVFNQTDTLSAKLFIHFKVEIQIKSWVLKQYSIQIDRGNNNAKN